ncbi:MAG TPA: universal stress protein [Geminicoccaceae bacterium]|nr:universal stress protein [Geminicoccaceae bacterium]
MRVILVPLLGDGHDRIALAAAYTIAPPFRSHIEAMFLRPELLDAIADLEGGSPEVLGSIRRVTTAKWDERSGRARAAFDDARSAAGAAVAGQPSEADATSTSWREMTGAAEAILPQAGRLADLIVFAGIGAHADEQRRIAFEAALVGAARPLLLVPQGGVGRIGRTIAVAWNGSVESTRALVGAMPLLRQADELHVLTAAGARIEVEQTAALAGYLGWHGLNAQQHALYPQSSAGEALLAKTKELGADLLVMGGYGHSRLRELIFGGVTRHVLHHYDLPVLITH